MLQVTSRWNSSAVERLDSNQEGLWCKSEVPAPNIVAGHQPVFLPAIVLFHKIYLADAFVFVGHCDFKPGSWHNRNRIRGHTGGGQRNEPLWLTVPCRHGISINETKLAMHYEWKNKMLNTIEQIYSKRPFFNDYYWEIAEAIFQARGSLSDLNIGLIRLLMHHLGIDTPTYCSENLVSHVGDYGRKTELLLDLCRLTGAKHYLSSAGEALYVDRTKFVNAGLQHSYQKFTHPIYEQGRREFMPDLSVIDLLFNCGPRSAEIVRGCGHVG